MAKGEKSMERGQLMIVSDWTTAHRINLGIYTCKPPPAFVELEMSMSPISNIDKGTQVIEITLYQGFMCQIRRHSRLD